MRKMDEIQEDNLSTEERIKEAARTVFTTKGYAATRTRDIAEASGVNLALLNYYFRSKEKLFDIIIAESLQGFIVTLLLVMNDEKTTLNDKVKTIANSYLDLLLNHQDLPLFVLTELKQNPKRLAMLMEARKKGAQSYFIKQVKQEIDAGNINVTRPIHFIMNLMSLIVFPFIGRPMTQTIGTISQQEFEEIIEERKKLIPIWIDAMFKKK